MPLFPGDVAPAFHAPSPGNPRYNFASVGGRYVVLVFLPGAVTPQALDALATARRHRVLFDDETRCLFGVLADAEQFAQARDEVPGIRWLHDVDGEVARLYEIDAPAWVVIDPSLRILFTAPLDQAAEVMARLALLDDVDGHAGVTLTAPVLIAPRIFDADLCRRLIAYYEADGGTPSGVMREIDGKTVGVLDGYKKRRDTMINDPDLARETREALTTRLAPQIRKVFQFKVSHIERYMVACYDAQDGGYFKPHRDDTTPGTAHRRFACSINLNAEDFEGGDLTFAEFGPKTYRPPTGGAVVFSCSLMHEATSVTKGKRYAFLPFFYDEAGAAIRQANLGTFDTAAEA